MKFGACAWSFGACTIFMQVYMQSVVLSAVDLFFDFLSLFDSLLLQAKSSAQRFKVTSQLRCLQEECGSSGGGDSCSPVAGDGERVATAIAAAATAASGPTGVEIHICDVHQEDSAVKDWYVATKLMITASFRL